jgi:general secretion pathway protein A
MIYGIQKREGFVAITGAVGVGKTTIVRAFLEKAKSTGLKVIYLFHAHLMFTDIVKTIYRELDLDPSSADFFETMEGLQNALIELHKQEKTIVLIIDEAQTVPIETLANLRMLSNMETQTEKLIQVVLVGQPELDEMLEREELRQLKQRIVVRAHIAALDATESRAYVAHRLSVAGLSDPAIFSDKALGIIFREAKGIPRVLNVLCNNALIAGFRRGENPVTASIANEIVTELAGKQGQPATRRWKVAALAGAALLAALLIAFFLSPLIKNLISMPAHSAKSEPALPQTAQPPQTELPAVPVPAAAPPPAPKKNVYTTRVVGPGDTLSGLIREVYHTSPKSPPDPSLVELVKQHNPDIIDSNVITLGSTIRFPERQPGSKTESMTEDR